MMMLDYIAALLNRMRKAATDGTQVTKITDGTDTLLIDSNGRVLVAGTVTPADGMANPTTAVNENALLNGWNGSTAWNRLIAGADNNDGVAGLAMGILRVRSQMMLFNGTSSDRARGDSAYGMDADVTRIATAAGKTVLYYQLSQASAGTTQIAAANANSKHKIIGFTVGLDANGTIAFTDGTITTGAIPVLASAPLVIPPGIIPWCETGAVNRAISIVTTGGKGFGIIQYLTEA